MRVREDVRPIPAPSAHHTSEQIWGIIGDVGHVARLVIVGCAVAAFAAAAGGCTSSRPSARGAAATATPGSTVGEPGATRPSPGCSTAASGTAGSPGSNRILSIAVSPAQQAGVSRRAAVVYAPAGYHSAGPAPLVLEFHGAGSDATAARYEAGSPLHILADSAGFLDVFPQGLRAPNGNLGWNAYGPVYWKVAEIPFVGALLAEVSRDYCVDLNRIYATGVSNGGNLVNYLACRDAAQFAAVATVAAPTYGQDDGPCRPSRPVPLVDIHSFDDPVVSYQGLPGPPANQFPMPSVAAWLAGWAGLDRCPPAPPPTTAPDGVQVRVWSGCASGARIVAYATHAGHGWPSSVSAGEPAAQTVWDFLAAYRS